MPKIQINAMIDERAELISFEPQSGLRAIRFGEQRMIFVQLCYDESSAQAVDPLCQPFRNEHLSKYFENKVIADLLAAGCHREGDFFAVLSWRFSAKIPLSISDVCRAMSRDEFSSDVYSFFGAVEPGRIWQLAEKKHPGIALAARVLFSELGLAPELFDLVGPAVYQNHFVARAEIYERYYRELLLPALRLMEQGASAELESLLSADSTYRNATLSKKTLRRIFGKPCITLHPFICERLFAAWLSWNDEVKLTHVWDGRFVDEKDVLSEPELAVYARMPADKAAAVKSEESADDH